MPFTVAVDFDNLGPEGEVQVGGIGVLQNGKTYKVSDEAAATFKLVHGYALDDESHPAHGLTVTRMDEEASE